jgi:DNA-binding CsgD family transcriptional regulator
MPAKGYRKPIAERFKGKYTVVDETGCWQWTSATAEGRYGMLWFADGKSKYAHRVSYELHIGPIPKGLVVCHRCDNGLCVNPDHLFAGTTKDNYDDMMSKGRGARQAGEWNPGSKLTLAQVDQIRKLKGGQRSQEEIAKQFDVSRGTIRDIWKGRSWAVQKLNDNWPEEVGAWSLGALGFGS